MPIMNAYMYAYPQPRVVCKAFLLYGACAHGCACGFFCLIYVSTERPAGDGEFMMKLTAGQTDGGSETHAQPAFC